MSVIVETIRELSLQQFDEILRESTDLGYGFLRRLADEWQDGTNRFDRRGEALFAARVGERLVGVCGLNQDPYAADLAIGRVRRLYVMRNMRGCGIGSRLVRRVLDEARVTFDLLHLRAADDELGHFYEGFGFVRVRDSRSYTHVLDLRGCSTTVRERIDPDECT